MLHNQHYLRDKKHEKNNITFIIDGIFTGI